MSLRLANAVLLLIILGTYAYLLLYYPFIFNFEVEINNHYYLIFLSVIYSMIFLSFQWFNRKDLTSLQGVLYFFVLIYLLYILTINRTLLSYEPLCVFSSLLLFALPFLSINIASLLDWVWKGLLFFYLIQLIWGVCQISLGDNNAKNVRVVYATLVFMLFI